MYVTGWITRTRVHILGLDAQVPTGSSWVPRWPWDIPRRTVTKRGKGLKRCDYKRRMGVSFSRNVDVT